MRVTRAFARDHGLMLPRGYEKSRQIGQESLYEQVQKKETGISKADHMRQVTEAWQQSDDARSFVHALAERGYILATGKRPYLLVDLYGNVNAPPKLTEDKAVRTSDIRAFLEKDFPPQSLPSVAQAEELVATHRKLIEHSRLEDQYAGGLADLKHQQKERRATVERARDQLAKLHGHTRLAMQQEHRTQRDELRHGYLKKAQDIRSARYRDRPTGLAAFLGRVSGVNLIRQALHRRDDAKRMKDYGLRFAELKALQADAVRALEMRLKIQAQEPERKQASLERVERRELAAFLRDQRTGQRVRDRGGDDRLPSLAAIHEERSGVVRAPDLLATFARAKQPPQTDVPDLMKDFDRAAHGRSKEDHSDGERTASDELSPPDLTITPRGRDTERNR